jgi:hypothetical protein
VKAVGFNRLPESSFSLSLLAKGSSAYIDLTWEEDTAKQGSDRSADPGVGMAGRHCQPPVKRAMLA